jgi:hypothetical protein
VLSEIISKKNSVGDEHKAMPILNDKNKPIFIKTISSRLDEIEKDTKKKRVEKVILKLKKK